MLKRAIFWVEGKLRKARAKLMLKAEAFNVLRLAIYIHYNQFNPHSGSPLWFHLDDVLFDMRRYQKNISIDMQSAALLHESLDNITVNELRDFLADFHGLDIDKVISYILDCRPVYTKEIYPDLSDNDRIILERNRQYKLPNPSRWLLVCDFRCHLKILIKHNSKLVDNYVSQFGPVEEALPFLKSLGK
ncbi:MAG: hypothetical protein ABJH04_08145 [Cyclobacteriaceae bacterium]